MLVKVPRICGGYAGTRFTLTVRLRLAVLGQALMPANLISHKSEKSDKVSQEMEAESESYDQDSQSYEERKLSEEKEHLLDHFTSKLPKPEYQYLASKIYLSGQNATQIPSTSMDSKFTGAPGVFSGNWNVKNSESIQLTFVNYTPHKLIFLGDYFDSSLWKMTWSKQIQPNNLVQGTVAGKSSWFIDSGVTGSIKLKINDTDLFIYVGFCNPLIGILKNYGEISKVDSQVRYGYDESNDSQFKSKSFGQFKIQVQNVKSPVAQTAFVYSIYKYC